MYFLLYNVPGRLLLDLKYKKKKEKRRKNELPLNKTGLEDNNTT